MRFALPILATLILLPALPARAGAAEGPGTAAVRKANDQVSTLLKRKVAAGSPEEKKLAAEITSQLRGFLDIDEMGKRALVDHWAQLSATDRAEFSKLLRELIEAHYVKGLRSNIEYKVKYLGEKPDAGGQVVNTEVETQRKGRPYKVSIDYKLRRDGGVWKAYDVVTDGIGMVENYRAQFNKIIAKDGMTGLLDRMRKKKATI
ncbi:MAG TPA: ABC transporter substrate-binding protein [Kofleriaceae bacterium]|nr:ABC transporter substrate-binding protein [Kofleriaceae bacterium]